MEVLSLVWLGAAWSRLIENNECETGFVMRVFYRTFRVFIGLSAFLDPGRPAQGGLGLDIMLHLRYSGCKGWWAGVSPGAGLLQ